MPRRFALAHLPSGPVVFQDVLRLAVADLGVLPRRSDWERVLERTRPLTRLAE